MVRMSSHFIGISRGKIELTFVGENSKHSRQFADEGDAVTALAEKMTETKCYNLLTSSSCDFPADDGRPAYNHEAFEKRLVHKLIELEG